MKKIGICLIMVFFASSAMATDYTKADRVRDMMIMTGGMKLIQNGFLYRCPDGECFIDGAKRILSVVQKLKTQEVRDFLPQDQKYAYKFGEKAAGMIELYAKDMIESVKTQNYDDALEDYNQIMRQCTSCHFRLRE